MTEKTDDARDWADVVARNAWLNMHVFSASLAEHEHDIKIMAQAIRDQPGRPPDYYVDMDPDLNPDEHDFQDAADVAASLCLGEISRYAAYFIGPIKYAARVSREGSDGPIDTEIQWFDTAEDALKAIGAKPGEGE